MREELGNFSNSLDGMNYNNLLALRDRITSDEQGPSRGLKPHEIHRLREKTWKKETSTYNK